uniref:Uncharacterized protein n=1 Tax=viral metagenome TaxID=1070528 RepID=A0A6C0BJW1_9ZZZZ
MAQKFRVSLVDPMIYHSTYVNRTSANTLRSYFWKKFNWLNFLFNVVLPITVVICVLFVLKDRYLTKRCKHSRIGSISDHIGSTANIRSRRKI